MHRVPSALLATALLGVPAAGATTAFDAQNSYLGATGAWVVENYEGVSLSGASDATMDAVYGETRYDATAGVDTHACAGGFYDAMSRSFRLTFTDASIASGGGVYGVGLEYASQDASVVAFVTFADDSTAEYPLPTAVQFGHKYFGVASDERIRSIHICHAGDTPATFSGYFYVEQIILGDTPVAPVADVYTDEATFLADTSGHIHETFDGLPAGTYTDEEMSAFYNETDYSTTQFPDSNSVSGGTYGGNHSRRMSFTDTSITEDGGIGAAGFRYYCYDERYVAFATFADGSTEQYPIERADIGSEAFLGIVSSSPLVSVHFGDINGAPIHTNGVIRFDEVILAQAPPPDCPGDLDGDNDTDVLDFATFASNFGQSVTPGTGGDFDANGSVDVLDFAEFLADFGCSL